MNKFTGIFLAMAVSSTATFSAQADDNKDKGVYAGVSSIIAGYEESGMPDLDLNYLQLQVGNRFNEHLAVEVRAGHGIGSDKTSVQGVSVELEADLLISAFVKGILPVGPVDLYALAGFTYAQLEASASLQGFTFSDEESGSDASYGIGMSISPSESTDIFVEYTSFYDKDSIEIDGFTLGVNFQF